jgi:hypothetical protein
MRKMISRSFAIAALLVVAGCSTAAQRQFQAMSAGNTAILSQAKTCRTAVYNSPEAALLRPHIPLDVRDATLAQMSDPTYPNQAEIAAAETLHPRVKACQRGILDGLTSTTPAAIPIMTEAFNAADDDLVVFVRGKMSWGERVKRARDRVVGMQQALNAVEQQVVSGLQQQHQAELDRRAAASAQLLNAAATYGVMAEPSRLPSGAYTLPSGQLTCVHNGPLTTCNW